MNTELEEKLRAAFEADLQQHLIQSLTPDRGYATPIDNLKALFESEIQKAIADALQG